MEAWRTDTLEGLHKAGDEPQASDLAAFLDTADLTLNAVQGVFDVAKVHTKHAPAVRDLTELFLHFAPLDKELTPEEVLQAATAVPLLTSAVKPTLDGKAKL